MIIKINKIQIVILIKSNNYLKYPKEDLSQIKLIFRSILFKYDLLLFRMLCSLGIPELLEDIKKDIQHSQA